MRSENHHSSSALELPARLAGYVLVVDDDHELRTSLAEYLADEGYRVIDASGGLQALAIMRPGNARPCVVLLDWNMPGLDGRRVIERMGATPHLAAIPTYVVTAAPHLVPSNLSVIDKGDLDSILEAVHAHCRPSAARARAAAELTFR